MAHAFDNRNFTHEKQPNQLISSYEDTHQYRNGNLRTDNYFPVTSDDHFNETKPPPPARIPRMISTSNTNTNSIRRSNILSQYSTNGMKNQTTYLNTTQLYISEPSSSSSSRNDSPPPPPPPPRHPLSPPVIPPRNPIISSQKNSITIPDFNSASSSKMIYRSPVQSSSSPPPIESNNSPLIIDTNSSVRDATIGEYFGQCCKCGETITSLDDPCDLLGQIYHASCAVCVICGQSVKNKHFYIKNELYCEEDFLNSDLAQTRTYCVVCHRLIHDTIIQAVGDTYHFHCFKCSQCSICLDGRPFIRDKNQTLFCLRDYHLTYGSRCSKCSKAILPEEGSNETVRILSMGKTFHLECYRCEDCSMQLGDEEDRRCYPINNVLLCQDCSYQRMIPINKF